MCRDMRYVGIATGLLLVACSGGSAPQNVSCQQYTLTHVTGLTNPHVATCDDPTCGNGTNPPVGGPHCPTPLACGTFPDAPNQCQWVHNLEHGDLVLLYNCPAGCPDVVSALQQIAQAAPSLGNGVPLGLVVGDPSLPTRVGAAVWGWSWTGNSVDAQAIACVQQHQGQESPEGMLACAAP